MRKILQLTAVFAPVILYNLIWREADSGSFYPMGLEFVVSSIIAIGLGLLAGYLLREKIKQPPDVPPSLSQRGTYTNWLCGVDRLGPAIGWVGDRITRKVRVSGNFLSKLFGNDAERHYFEGAVHWIGPGPYDEIRDIYENGSPISTDEEGNSNFTPLYREVNPSGSTITLPGGQGSFKIFWGEERQPVNTFIGDSSRIGISSRWPFMCYIQWIDKHLGASPQWPQMNYVMVKRTSDPAGWVGITPDELGPNPIERTVPPPTSVTETSDGFGNTYYVLEWDNEPDFLEAIDDGPCRLFLNNVDGYTGMFNLASQNPEAGLSIEAHWDHSNDFDFIAGILLFDGTAARIRPWYENPNPFVFGASQAWTGSGTVGFAWRIDTAATDNFPVGARFAFHGEIEPTFVHGGFESWVTRRQDVGIPGIIRLHVLRKPDRDDDVYVEDPPPAPTYVPNGVLTQLSNALWGHYRWPIIDVDYEANTFTIQTYYAEVPAGQQYGVFGDDLERTGFITVFTVLTPTTVLLQVAASLEDLEVEVGEFFAFASGTSSDSDGALPSYAIRDLLFLPWPQGMGIPETDWDLSLLDEVGEAEQYRGLLSGAGDEVEKLLGVLLQDTSTFLPLQADGRFQFRPIRAPEDPKKIPVLPIEMTANLAKRKIHHGMPISSRVVFAFRDRGHRFRDITIGQSSAGHFEYEERADASTVQIPTTSSFTTAVQVAARRSMEDLGGTAQTMSYDIGRGGRRLVPGDIIRTEDYPDNLRVLSVEPSPNTSTVKVTLTPDFMGVDPAALRIGGAGGGGGQVPAVPDLALLLFEVPEMVGISVPLLWVPRIRAHAGIHGADILWDIGGPPAFLAFEVEAGAGGTLLQPLRATDLFIEEEGPTFAMQGPDIGNLLDLTLDEDSWRLGRQVAFVGNEILYVRKVTILDTNTARLDGVIRARLDTRRQTHDIGAKIVIMVGGPSALPQPLPGGLLAGNQLTVTSQPRTFSSLSLLNNLTATRILYGNVVRPPMPSSGIVEEPVQGVPAFVNGDDITLSWSYSAPRTPASGAGVSGAGDPITYPPPEGPFEIRVTRPDDPEVLRVETVTDPTWSYSAANRSSDFGGDEDVRVWVYQIREGAYSDPLEFILEFLA